MSLNPDLIFSKKEKKILNKINKDNITPQNLLKIYDELITISKNYNKTNKYKNAICELISISIEFLLKSGNESGVFDAFCSFNFMNEYLTLSKYNIYLIDLQIIKSFCFLLVNIQNPAIIYFILSGNLIEFIISKDYCSYDEEFFSYYVNFLKSISLRIDENSVKLFFRENINSFPLIERAIKIYNHNDSMVRNVVRNIIVNILKIKYDKIEDFFCQLPAISYFPNLCCHLRDICIKFQEEIYNEKKYDDYFDDIIEELYFFDDIFSLKLEKINYILLNSLFYYFILPILCCSFLTQKKPILDINISLFLIIILFKNIKYETFRNCLFSLIFLDKLNQDILNLLIKPNDLPYYSFVMENKKTSFSDFLSQNYSLKFSRHLMEKDNINYLNYKEKYPELETIILKYNQFISKNKNRLDEDIIKEGIESILISSIKNDEYVKMNIYHNSICYGTGIKLGLYSNSDNTEIYNICFMCLMKSIFEELKDNNQKNNNVYISNTIKEGLLYLLTADDDNLVLLISILIYVCQNSNISKTLLNKAHLENLRNKKNEKLKEIKNQKINLKKQFSQEYTLSFSNNAFIFNNEYFELDKELNTELDLKLIKIIINLFCYISPPFRKLTYRIIFTNLRNLILDKDNIKSNLLPKDIYETVVKNQIKILTKIQKLIQKEKIYRDNGYLYFNEEWNLYLKDNEDILKKDIQSIISNPYILLEKKENNNIPLILRQKVSENLIFKELLLLYMYIHDLREILLIHKNQNEEINNKLIKEKNPLIEKKYFEFELDKNYDLTKISEKNEENIMSYQVVHFKTVDLPYYEKMLLIIFYPYIYFGTTNKENVLIQYKYKMTDLGIYQNKNENKENENILYLLVINQNENNGKDINICIKFKNVESINEVSSKIIDGNQELKNHNYLIFNSFFEDEMRKLNEEK